MHVNISYKAAEVLSVYFKCNRKLYPVWSIPLPRSSRKCFARDLLELNPVYESAF